MRFPQFLVSLVLVAASFLAASPHLAAQELEGVVTVKDVDFNNDVRPFNWNNIVITLVADENPLPGALNPEFVDNIGVKVTIAYKNETTGDGFHVYQAECEIIALERGQDKDIAFWLPEIVVDQLELPNEPEYWLIELTVDGKPIQLADAHVSRTLGSRKLVDSFKTNVIAKAKGTGGIFVPTYLSPYPESVVDDEPAAFRRFEAKESGR